MILFFQPSLFFYLRFSACILEKMIKKVKDEKKKQAI